MAMLTGCWAPYPASHCWRGLCRPAARQPWADRSHGLCCRPLVLPTMEVPVPTSSRSLQVNVPSAPDAEQPEHGGGAFYSPASSLNDGSSPGEASPAG